MIMTPKEKAKELVRKIKNIDSDSEIFDGFTMELFYAQRASIIAVTEIINAIAFDFENPSENTIYWLRVKQEIQKL